MVIAAAAQSAITAREAALKVREASRVLAEGYDAEFLLHGSAVPLTAQDHLVVITTPDEDGLVGGIASAAEAEGVPVTKIGEPAPLPLLLAQIPLAVRFQMLALRFALTRGQDPDKVIVGAWDDQRLWSIGAPG
jgi:glutamine---fructose-6-phosphate transaminase (isomerizing)